MPGPSRTEIDGLDDASPAAFVRTRNALVARLREAGRTGEATELARRRRPGAVPWLVNRLARTDATGVKQLLEATARLRRAYRRDPREIHEATARHRESLQRLVQRAERILIDSEMRGAPEILRRVHATLSAAAADRRQHPALRQGRVTEEVAPRGFEVMEGAAGRHLTLVKPDRQPPAPAPARRVTAKQRQAAERAKRRAEREAEAAERRRKRDGERRQRAIDRESRRADRLREQLRTIEASIARERAATGRPD